ncbi:hypothetical protein BT63DRAFT_437116 [Microthyrium microscopicum]|uniref:Chitin-binding type-1 domain-containing protein n=1 Tax=Microthyrium microscopicum TaxID=703497 RepID=A0A6A6UPK6_9PEZI|nr:hypothetical protein BT63DRAFT_437116 [Microthyrium microscopicum]
MRGILLLQLVLAGLIAAEPQKKPSKHDNDRKKNPNKQQPKFDPRVIPIPTQVRMQELGDNSLLDEPKKCLHSQHNRPPGSMGGVKYNYCGHGFSSCLEGTTCRNLEGHCTDATCLGLCVPPPPKSPTPLDLGSMPKGQPRGSPRGPLPSSPARPFPSAGAFPKNPYGGTRRPRPTPTPTVEPRPAGPPVSPPGGAPNDAPRPHVPTTPGFGSNAGKPDPGNPKPEAPKPEAPKPETKSEAPKPTMRPFPKNTIPAKESPTPKAVEEGEVEDPKNPTRGKGKSGLTPKESKPKPKAIETEEPSATSELTKPSAAHTGPGFIPTTPPESPDPEDPKAAQPLGGCPSQFCQQTGTAQWKQRTDVRVIRIFVEDGDMTTAWRISFVWWILGITAPDEDVRALNDSILNASRIILGIGKASEEDEHKSLIERKLVKPQHHPMQMQTQNSSEVNNCWTMSRIPQNITRKKPG